MTEIVINHLTRMKPPRICVAGVVPERMAHVRLVTNTDQQLSWSLLRERGGVFRIGERIEIDGLVPDPSPPEVEDHVFQIDAARSVGRLGETDYLDLIDRMCRDDFWQVFGGSLRLDGWSFSVDQGEGVASLGCLRVPPSDTTELFVNDYGRVSLRLRAPGKPLYLPVTDVRCYEDDLSTPNEKLIQAIQSRLSGGVPLRLMVGLSHPWAKDRSRPRHWVQVNGLCLEDSPLGNTP